MFFLKLLLNRSHFYSIVISICLLCGIFLFFIKRDLIIFQFNFGVGKTGTSKEISKNLVIRKKIRLYGWKRENIYYESENVIWFTDKAESLKHLVNRWLLFLQEERIIGKKIMAESVALSETGQEAFCSFDQYPFVKDWSIFQKLCFLDCLFKTIFQSDFDVKKMNFFVKDQVLTDDHLDFSVSWPIDGFLPDNFFNN